jgi:hypothetical protein
MLGYKFSLTYFYLLVKIQFVFSNNLTSLKIVAFRFLLSSSGLFFILIIFELYFTR